MKPRVGSNKQMALPTAADNTTRRQTIDPVRKKPIANAKKNSNGQIRNSQCRSNKKILPDMDVKSSRPAPSDDKFISADKFDFDMSVDLLLESPLVVGPMTR